MGSRSTSTETSKNPCHGKSGTSFASSISKVSGSILGESHLSLITLQNPVTSTDLEKLRQQEDCRQSNYLVREVESMGFIPLIMHGGGGGITGTSKLEMKGIGYLWSHKKKNPFSLKICIE